MPSTTRFRSRTSDLSEFIRGSSSKNSSETHLKLPLPSGPVPPLPQVTSPPETAMPTKTRRGLGFLTRKPKSDSVSPSQSSSSLRLGESSGIPGSSQDTVPPLPNKNSRRTPEIVPSRTSRSSSSQPPSLPVPNVSPPSLGSFASELSHIKTIVPDVTQTPDLGRSSSSSLGVKSLRGQKSISFEPTSRKSLSQTPNRGGRPVITVSPPRTTKEETNVAAPPPPPPQPAPQPTAAPTKPLRSLRRPMMLPFSQKKSEPEKPLPVTSALPPSVSPDLPPTMQFPLPPTSQVTQPPKVSSDDTRSKRETMSTSSRSIGSPTSERFSDVSRQTSRGTSQTSRDMKDLADQPSPTSTLRFPEESPPRSRLTISTTGHAALVRHTPGPGSSATSSSPVKYSLRRGSRSPSPAGTPPTAPLPLLPPEAYESPISSPTKPAVVRPSPPTSPKPQHLLPASPVARAVSPPQNSTTVPVSSSLLSGRTVSSLRQQVLRPRANTIPSPIHPVASPQLSSVLEAEKPKDVEVVKVPAVGTFPASGTLSKLRADKENERERRGSSSTVASVSSPPMEFSTPPRKLTDSPLYDDIMSLRATHEEYVRSIRETHAMEKAELLRRIDHLEHEARKRDREIKGLRWLVMNASGGSNLAADGIAALSSVPSMSSLSTAEAPTRFRSGSKSSQFSQVSSSNSVVSLFRSDPTPAVASRHTPRNSTEEGLYELHAAVSDLIAPLDLMPSLAEKEADSPTDPDGPGFGRDKPRKSSSAAPTDFTRRLRRSNTAPTHEEMPPPPSSPTSIPAPKASPLSPALRSGHRTSSPVLPHHAQPTARPSVPSAGLGFDIPSSPPSSYRVSATDTTLSTASSIPSLVSNVSTASSASALSAIPESLSPHSSRSTLEVDKERARRDKEERRASRALKRISTSSTSSLLSAVAPYNPTSGSGSSKHSFGNDTFDRSAGSSMEQVLRKLRAFGGPEVH